MSRETEFLTRHKEDLKRAAELCRILQKNAAEPRPRELHYLELMRICKRLEGSCRQMAHERGDDFTWLRLGIHYHKTGEMVRLLRRGQKWLSFGKLAEVFDAGLAKVDRLAHTANGISSLSSSPVQLTPQWIQTPGGIILPS